MFESFSPIVEPLSLDEAFIDLTGTERLLGPPLDAARDLKRRVLEETGLVVSVGVAPTKMAAKILSDMSKPDGLLSVAPEKLREFLTPLPVERLWGVGRVTLARMHECGITTIGDLARRDAGGVEEPLRHRWGRICMNSRPATTRGRWWRTGSASRTARKILSRTTWRSTRMNCAAC